MAAQPERVGGYQAVCLAVVTAATLVYTLNKKRIKTMRVQNPLVCIAVGLTLGIMSSFLEIGGPINLVVLYFFFSMETKEAAQNSLYIILISQITSLLTSIVTSSIPLFHISWLVVIVPGGIGGMVGRKLNKRLNTAMVDKLFAGLILVIIGISCYNAWRFLR